MRISLLSAFAAAACLHATAFAQTTFTWTGAADGNWSSALNWDPATGAPPGTTATDIARFDADVANNAVSLGAATTIAKLEFATGAGSYAFTGEELTVNGSGTLLSNASGNEQTFSGNVRFVSGGTITFDVATGSTVTFASDVTGPGSNRNLTVTGGGVVNFNGRFTSYTAIQQLRVETGSTINYNTTTNSGASSYWAVGGRINLHRATGTSGISLNLVGDNSEIYLSQAGLIVGAVNANLRGDLTNKVVTFGADFAGTGTATYTGSVNLNSTTAGADNTYRLYAAAGNTFNLSGVITDANASASGTKVEIAGEGVVRYSGTTANTSVTPILISENATLELAKAEGVDAIGGGGVTIDTDGILRLAASHQIADSTALTFAGGLFDVGVNTEALGSLAVGADGGAIDFGGLAGSLNFADLTSIVGMLTIDGWNENASITFTDGSGWDEDALSRVIFTGYGAAQFDTETNRLFASAAIPEPSSAAAIAAGLALGLGILRRRR